MVAIRQKGVDASKMEIKKITKTTYEGTFTFRNGEKESFLQILWCTAHLLFGG